jgi:diguanylate cyclase (GGDEF)-like protein
MRKITKIAALLLAAALFVSLSGQGLAHYNHPVMALIPTPGNGITDGTQLSADERIDYLSALLIITVIVIAALAFVLARNVKLSKELKSIANIDSLTCIYNRRHFMELADMQAARSLRTGHASYLIIFDLDHFKSVNDSFGHQAGDKVLFEIARRVKETIRPYDLFGRYGGEEFIILMLDLKETDKESVISAVERLRLAINSLPVVYEGQPITISASFGISHAAPKHNMDIAIKYADDALYQAKEAGRDRVIFYTEGRETH